MSYTITHKRRMTHNYTYTDLHTNIRTDAILFYQKLHSEWDASITHIGIQTHTMTYVDKKKRARRIQHKNIDRLTHYIKNIL